jgi:hypothetical protein
VACWCRSRHAVDDHQTRNAEYLVERGAARLLPQATLAGRLRDALAELAADPAQRLAMARAARGLARPDAADHVAQACSRKHAAGDTRWPAPPEQPATWPAPTSPAPTRACTSSASAAPA